MTLEAWGINPRERGDENIEYPFPDIPAKMKVMLLVNELRGLVMSLKSFSGPELERYKEGLFIGLKRIARWLREVKEVPEGLIDKVNRFHNLVYSLEDDFNEENCDKIESIGKEINDLLNARPIDGNSIINYSEGE